MRRSKREALLRGARLSVEIRVVMMRRLRQMQLVAFLQAAELTLQRKVVELNRIRLLIENRAVLTVRSKQSELLFHLDKVVLGVF